MIKKNTKSQWRVPKRVMYICDSKDFNLENLRKIIALENSFKNASSVYICTVTKKNKYESKSCLESETKFEGKMHYQFCVHEDIKIDEWSYDLINLFKPERTFISKKLISKINELYHEEKIILLNEENEIENKKNSEYKFIDNLSSESLIDIGPKTTKLECLFPVTQNSKIEITIQEKNIEEIHDINSGVLLVKFKDAQKRIININIIHNLNWSDIFGSLYKYLVSSSNGLNRFSFKVPIGAAYCEISPRIWKAKRLQILNKISIEDLPTWVVDDFVIPKVKKLDNSSQVASICDKFTYETLSYDLNLIPLERVDWKKQFKVNNIELLLVESAWDGNDGKWKYALTNPDGEAFHELKQVIKFCNINKIKTLFYNKEDPPNYEVFIHAAKLFDVIVTSDVNCIDKYKHDCEHQNIFVMPFAAQPKIHNPMGKKEFDDYQVAFAGTWYKNKHHDRSNILPILLNEASKYNLTIFDRQSSWTKDDSYKFPDAYKQFVQEKVSYEEMLNIHKMFQIMLNVNSVFDSETMFSRRVFEILASSTPVLSTPSLGISKIFDDVVPIVNNAKDARLQLSKLLGDDLYRKKAGHRGLRSVMTRHTVKHRLFELFKSLDINYPEIPLPKVSMAIPTNRPEHLNYIRENLLRQSYKNLEAILILNSNKFNLAEVQNNFKDIAWVKVIQIDEEMSLGACLNASIEISTGDYWAKLDDDNIYLEDFITDLMLPFKYSDEIKIVAKGSYFTYLEATKKLILRFPGQENKWVNFASGSALIVEKEILNQIKFPDTSKGEDTKWMNEVFSRGYKMYSADIFNYVVIRRSDIQSHTWKVSDIDISKGSVAYGDGLNLDIVRA